MHDSRLLTDRIEVVDDERTCVPVFLLPFIRLRPHGPPADALTVDRHRDVLTRDRTWRVRRNDIWLVGTARINLHVFELAAERARRLGGIDILEVLILLCRPAHYTFLLHDVGRVLVRVR